MLKKTVNKSKEWFLKCDWFGGTRLLRYDDEPQYNSASGAIVSIAIFIAFAIIFAKTISDTLNKSNITALTTLSEEVNPSLFQTTTSGFMFAIGMTNFNITDQNTKYFNIQFTQKISNPKSTTSYTLVPCSRSVWTQTYPDIGDSFDRLQLQNWLCLPPNTNLEFQGKYTSDIFQYIKIGVKACSPTAGDNRTCVNQSYIDNMIATSGPISFNYYFMNTIINANDQNYLGSYLEDRNYFTFTMQTGTTANLFISVYDIQSDVSLMPMKTIAQDTGGIVYEPTQNFVQAITSGNPYYIQLYLRKSSLQIAIQRRFYKYDECLAYIGGLFSAIMTVFAFMTFYKEYAYEIDVTSGVYKQTKKKKIQSKYFNMLTFIVYLFYCVINFFGANPKWQLLKQFDKSRQQISKQLDIKLILKKIGFLEDCMEYLFEDFQLKCLHLKGKLTLQQAATIRKRFSSRPLLLKLKRKRQKQDQPLKQMQLKKKESVNPQEPFNEEIIQSRSHSPLKSAQQMIDSKEIILAAGNQDNRPIELELKKERNKDEYKQAQDSNQERKKKKYKQGQDNNSEDSQASQEDNLSQSSETEEKQFYQDILNSIYTLEEEAKTGKRRCIKIFNNLDRIVKNIAGITSSEEISLQSRVKKFPSMELLLQKKHLK